ncbi:MAG TPA: CHASE2 domain-containing protein, partial [Bdellovibrionota bacterium]|nr:CHASE2 domain-containing protein [Bdellovibrionota bacterium]
MKKRLWLIHIPLIILFASAFVVTWKGELGSLDSAFLRDLVFPPLRSLNGAFTNAKFKIRGPHKPTQKIVIIEADSESMTALGRWPWHRDFYAQVIGTALSYGAKVVGLDYVLSEPDQRVPDGLRQALREKKLDDVVAQAETDRAFVKLLQDFGDRIVLGWTSEAICQPSYVPNKDECPVNFVPDTGGEPLPEEQHPRPPSMHRFAVSSVAPKDLKFDSEKTPLLSVVQAIAPYKDFSHAASHAGFFNVFPDPDGYIRRTPLLMMMDGIPFPSLALETARVGLGEDMEVEFSPDQRFKQIRFKKSGRIIPLNPMGSVEINFM